MASGQKTHQGNCSTRLCNKYFKSNVTLDKEYYFHSAVHTQPCAPLMSAQSKLPIFTTDARGDDK